MINEYDKIKLKTGEIARVVEILEKNKAYVAEVYTKDSLSVEFIYQQDIASVFVEKEYPLGEAI
jgi:hypothetical protein